MTVPPKVGAADFRKAIKRFEEVVGTDWTFDDDAARASYLDPFAIGDPRDHEASAIVAPGDVEELRGVLAVANDFGIPLWPVSMGKNFAYGAAAPAQRGTVVLDLKRLNRVLELNEELGYVLVEPGVSFFDLKEYLDSHDSGLWMSGPSHSWGSVIGNALEHGVGYTPYGVHAEMICGMEVMLADGSLVRTGLGGVPGTREWQCYKWPFGPNLDGMFTQSNFGVVTKMGLWLMPEPHGMAGVTISAPGRGDLAGLVEALRPLRLDDTINATYTIANGWRIASRGRRHAELEADPYTPVSAAKVEQVLRDDGAGWWSVIFNLFDRPDALDIRLRAIRERFGQVLPDAEIRVRRWQRGEALQPWMRQGVGVGALGIADWYGSPGGHTDFAPIVAADGARVAEVYELIERRFLEYGADPWIGMFGMGARALVFVADLFYKRTDTKMVDARRALFARLCEDMNGMGVGLYRSHISLMEDAARMYNWNDSASRALNSRIKQALDPAGILAPGKQGIGS